MPKNYFLEKKKPSKLDESKLDEIIRLHQTFFNVSKASSRRTIKKYHLIYLYRERSSGQLIGFRCNRWIPYKNKIIVWTGPVGVHADYEKQGILPSATFHTWLDTILKYPFRALIYGIYHASTVATSKMYTTIQQRSYPNPERKTPQEIMKLMEFLADSSFGKENYDRPSEDIFIIDVYKAIYDPMHGNEQSETQFYDPSTLDGVKNDFFQKFNPNAHQGHALLVITEHSNKRLFRYYLKKLLP